ncbi:hypothetical protein GCM10009549_35700 [Streptomyces thermoalcalitolerans]|uniref:Uncharacterized protein n=1 Tax=Streptomyces thermoalcalitolerans TaxID=65605 RepID=A0ABP3ZDD4_9ACTN
MLLLPPRWAVLSGSAAVRDEGTSAPVVTVGKYGGTAVGLLDAGLGEAVRLLRLPGNGRPTARTIRVFAVISTCGFVEYWWFFEEAANEWSRVGISVPSVVGGLFTA